jgi:hypothetical protein
MPEAIDTSKVAGVSLSKEELNNYINKYLDEGRIYSAVDAAKLIGAPLPADKLVSIGRKFLMSGNLNSGMEAYELAGKTPTKEMLRECGEICLIERLKTFYMMSRTDINNPH